MQKIRYLLLLLFIFVLISCSDNSTNTPIDNYVDQLINNVNTDSMKLYLEKLTGAKPVIIDGVEKQILSRHKDAPGNNIAADYIEKKLSQFGYTVINDNFNSAGRNVVAELKGSVNPDQYYIICAHYDSMPSKGNAPGADDNGSGTVAVLEAARLLSKYEPSKSIIFALWDEEEVGLLGSKHYAAIASGENKNILGVINLDMIAYDSDSDNKFSFIVLSEGEESNLVEEGKNILDKYNLGLSYNFVYGSTYSDHAAFWLYNYPAITIIEDTKDFNINYHTDKDQEMLINYTFFRKSTQLAIGILAKSAF